MATDFYDLDKGSRGLEGYGHNGVRGMRYDDKNKINIKGFEQKTVGLPGNVKHRMNVQNGIISADPSMVAAREPIRVGRFILKWLKYPPFFANEMKELMRYMLEDNVKGVSGVPSNSIQKFEITNGPTKIQQSYPGMYEQSGGSMSLKVPEFSGSPLRKLLQYWLYGISDPKTGVMHFWGKRMRGLLPNYAGSFIYIVLGPTCRADDIEYACMLHECFPVSEKADHFSSDLGEVGSGQELDIEFSGMFDHGPHIDALAQQITNGFGLYNEDYLQSRLPAYLYPVLTMTNEELISRFGGDVATRLRDEAMREIYSSENLDIHKAHIDTNNTEPIPDANNKEIDY